MGFYDIFKGTDINIELQEAREVSDVVILDVRDTDEFRRGHIPGALNIPLDRINDIRKIIKKKDTHIYVYCLRGSRSSRAVTALKKAGYTNAKSIGGINRYKGKIEKGDKGPITLEEMMLYDIIDDD